MICTRPFEWLEVHPEGDAFLCCPAWLRRPVGNLCGTPLREIWNSPVAREIRASILNGSFHNCSARRCPHLARKAPPVCRIADLDDEEVARALSKNETFLSFGPKVLNLSFDRGCNLACPTCRKEPFRHDAESLRRCRELARKIVAEGGAFVERLRLSGEGDPFSSPVYREILQNVGPETFPKLEAIHLHTNAILWNEERWGAIASIHPYVKTAEISVDAATAATYEINRRPASFDRLQGRLTFIATLPISVTLSFVVQANNFREMEAFVALCRRYGFAAYFSPLVNWGTFTKSAYRERGVHLPEHPEHDELNRIVRSLACEADVDLGLLAHLAQRA